MIVQQELLAALAELSETAPELRLGQLVANIATLAHGAKVEAIWDAEDEEMLAAAKRLLEHYRARTRHNC
ncbi:MAG TPA: hypothetical protein VKS79_05555 [Gemmataceae bacterium]|nr:hypothetical protein [Gemmataceae bacterium]